MKSAISLVILCITCLLVSLPPPTNAAKKFPFDPNILERCSKKKTFDYPRIVCQEKTVQEWLKLLEELCEYSENAKLEEEKQISERLIATLNYLLGSMGDKYRLSIHEIGEFVNILRILMRKHKHQNWKNSKDKANIRPCHAEQTDSLNVSCFVEESPFKDYPFEECIIRLLEIARRTPVFLSDADACWIVSTYGEDWTDNTSEEHGTLNCRQNPRLKIILDYYIKSLAQCMDTDSLLVKENIVVVFHSLFCNPSHAKGAIKFDHLLISLEENWALVMKYLNEFFTKSSGDVYKMLLEFTLTCSIKSVPIGLSMIDNGWIGIVLKRMVLEYTHQVYNRTIGKGNFGPMLAKYRNQVLVSTKLLSQLLSTYRRVRGQDSSFNSSLTINEDDVLSHNEENVTEDDIEDTKPGICIPSEAICIVKMIKTAINPSDDSLFTKQIRNELMNIFVNLQMLFKSVRKLVNQFQIQHDIVFSHQNTSSPFKTSFKDKEDEDFAKLVFINKLILLKSLALTREEKLELARQCVPDMINDKQFLIFRFVMGRNWISYLKEEFLYTKNCQKLIKIAKKIFEKGYENFSQEVTLEVLKTFNFITNMKDSEPITNMLRKNYAISLFVNEFSKMLHTNASQSDIVLMNQVIQTLIGLTQNNLPAQKKHYKDFKNIFEKSVQIIQLENTLMLFAEQELMTSVVQLVFKSIINNSENRERFLGKYSVYKLIDLLRINCESLHLIVLDILRYLTDCPSSYPYLFTWYEKISGKSLISKLCECWRTYDKQYDCRNKPERKVELEVKISCLIMDLLGDKQSIAEYFEKHEQHKIHLDNLEMKDKLTIAMIDDYTKLKID
ncbi:hypothetical protein WDU94_007459 [Cyamophila willieti]